MKHNFNDHSPECCGPKFPPFCPEDKPPMGRPPMPPCGPMPPCPSVVSGMDLYEAVNNLTDRVNVCIHNYNAVMAENYKTLHNLQQAAQENGAYYGPDEVWVEEGYYADESSTYHLVHKACVDRRGEPIRMQLHLAYGNTTNSKIEQGIFNASKVEFADKMLVAIPKSENGWYGKAIWHGAPIQSADEPTLYTVGFTRAGVMRVYNNGVSVDQMLRDTIENAMGCSGVLIQNGQVTDDSYRANIPNAGQQTSRVCIGQNIDTREVIILTVGNENDVNRKGLTSKACAEILLGQGCDIAVELCEGVGSAAMDKGSLMYVPDDEQQPNAYAFWFISRKCFYKTDYERELAELIQNYGACIWDGFLNKKNIESVKNDLDAEIARAVAAENALGERVTEEVTRAKGEEQRIEGKVDAEIQRAKDAEAELQESINDETLRAKAEEQRIDAKVDAEVKRATDAEDELGVKIDAEVNRAKAEEQRIDGKVDAESARAKAAEGALQSALDKEVHDRTNADSTLHQEILTEQGERTAADTVLQNNINSEASSRATEDGKLQASIDAEVQTRTSEDANIKSELGGKIEALTVRVTQCETDIHQLDSLTSQMQQQMSGLDKNVSDMLVTVSKLETAMENVKQTVLNMNTVVTELNAKYEEMSAKVDGITSGETALPYVKKSGDTMTGPLVMGTPSGYTRGSVATTNHGIRIKQSGGAFIKVDNGEVSIGNNDEQPTALRGVADGVYDHDAVNIKQLNAAAKSLMNGSVVLPYVKKNGDAMSGALTFTSEYETEPGNPDSGYGTSVDGKIYGSSAWEENPEDPGAGPMLKSYLTLKGDSQTFTISGGEISVDNAKIKNLSPGSDDNDAVTVGQLQELAGIAHGLVVPAPLIVEPAEGEEISAGTIGYEMDTHRLYIEKSNSGSGITFDNGYVSLGGPTAIAMRLTNVENGESDTDAVNKRQLDAAIAGATGGLPYVKKAGDTMTGPLVMADSGGTEKGSFAAADGGVSIKAANGAFVKVDGSQVTIGDNAGNSVKLKGVKDATADDEAVNMAQLSDVSAEANAANSKADEAIGNAAEAGAEASAANTKATQASAAASAADAKATQASAAASAADAKATQASAAASAADAKATQAGNTANAAKSAADDAAAEAIQASADVAEIVAGTKVLPYVKPINSVNLNLNSPTITSATGTPSDMTLTFDPPEMHYGANSSVAYMTGNWRITGSSVTAGSNASWDVTFQPTGTKNYALVPMENEIHMYGRDAQYIGRLLVKSKGDNGLSLSMSYRTNVTGGIALNEIFTVAILAK